MTRDALRTFVEATLGENGEGVTMGMIVIALLFEVAAHAEPSCDRVSRQTGAPVLEVAAALARLRENGVLFESRKRLQGIFSDRSQDLAIYSSVALGQMCWNDTHATFELTDAGRVRAERMLSGLRE